MILRRALFWAMLLAMVAGRASAQPKAPILWQKCLGGTADDYAYQIIQTSDGGFAIAGYTASQNGNVTGNHGGEDGWVVKLDSNGTIQWAKCYGGAESDYLYSIVQTSDGGYAVAGLTYSNDGEVSGNHGGGDAWVIRLNDTGGIQWQQCFGGTNVDEFQSIVQTTDGGFVAAGLTYSTNGNVSGNHGDTDAWVVKLNSSGTMQWQKCHGGSSDDLALSIIQTNDHGYAFVGTTSSSDGEVSGYHGGGADVWVAKLDTTGAIQWQHALGGTQEDDGVSIIQTLDSGYALGCQTASNDGNVTGNHGAWDAWIVRLNASGSTLWDKCYGGSAVDGAAGIFQTSDSGFIFDGATSSDDDEVSGNHGNLDAWVVKLNDTGAMQWQRCLGGTNWDDDYSNILQTKSGKYAIAATTGSNDSDVTGNHDGLDMWAVLLGNPDPPVISYITPDAGAPGMCVAVEIIGPANDMGNFGDDTMYSTNALVSLVNPSDSAYIRLGPSIVSWNGRMIQQMFLIEPQSGAIHHEVYFSITVNGNSTVDSFFVVSPTHIGTLTSGGTLPTTGVTTRNTMVVDSLILENGTYNCPANGFPLRILSLGPIRLNAATLSANGAAGVTGTGGGAGGPGGGGGGGGYPGAGGSGFTGGGGDNNNSTSGGSGTGSVSNSSTGGSSLNGIPGGTGEVHSGFSGDDGGGGGTGSPFGTSGVNGNASSSPAGGYGAGSAGGSTSSYTTNYGGGGGGFDEVGSPGQGTGNNGGQVYGNAMLIPLMGGSGGGAGNCTHITTEEGGSGGGGGGAIDLTSFKDIELNNTAFTITAGGGTGSNGQAGIESGAGGGGGSGGAIMLSVRDSVWVDINTDGQLNAASGAGGSGSSNGSRGGNGGGVGRYRINGQAATGDANVVSTDAIFVGPAIQSVNYTTDSAIIIGYAEYWGLDTIAGVSPIPIEVFFYWKSEGFWQSVNAIPYGVNGSATHRWTVGIPLSRVSSDTELYMVAVQNENSVSSNYTDVPTDLMSHTSGIIAKVTGPPNDSIAPLAVNFGDVLVKSCSNDTNVIVYSTGKSPLIIDSASLVGIDNSQFKILTALPVSVQPGSSFPLSLQFCPDSVVCPLTASLKIYTDAGTLTIALTGCGVQPQMVIHPTVLDFGRVHIGDCKDSFVVVSNPGKDSLTITVEDIMGLPFSSIDPLPMVVAPGDSAHLNLRFCPSDTIVNLGNDSVIGDAPQSPVSITLLGRGKIGILSMPSAIDYGLVREDSCKDTTFYAKNVGNDTMVIETGIVTGPGFTPISPTFPDTLQIGDSMAIDIRFCSSDTGTFNGSARFGTDIPNSDTVELLAHTGIGILQMLTTIDFDSVPVGGCKDTTIALKNIGTDVLTLSPGTNIQPPFSYQGPAELRIAPGAIDSITLQFCPADTNEATEQTQFGTVGIAVNQSFTLRGKGIEGALSTSGAIDIGCIVINSSATETLRIADSGEAPLQGIMVSVTPAGSVQIVHTPPTTLAVDASDSVVVIVPATTLGHFLAQLTLTSAGQPSVTIPITAQVAAAPALVSLDNPLPFDSTDIGDSSVLTCLTVTNYSCIPYVLDSISIAGSSPGEFEIVTNSFPQSLSDSVPATICLRYKPQQIGNAVATLVGYTNGTPVTISTLNGYGIGQGVAVQLAIDTVAGTPGEIVNVPVRALNDVTGGSITTVTFRVTFNPMQLDLKSPIAPPVGSSMESSNTPTYSMTSNSIGDKVITATFPQPLTGEPIVAELPFEILEPTSNTAAVHLQSASFGTSPSTLASSTDGLIQIEQCDTNSRIAIAPGALFVAPNNPNPFSSRTAVAVTVNYAGHVRMEVYNALGMKVLVPFDADVPVGTQMISIDASALPNGAYRYITTWSWNGTSAPRYQPTYARDEKTMIVIGE